MMMTTKYWLSVARVHQQSLTSIASLDIIPHWVLYQILLYRYFELPAFRLPPSALCLMSTTCVVITFHFAHILYEITTQLIQQRPSVSVVP